MAAETFLSLHPATDEEIGRFPIVSPEEVDQAVKRAISAGIWWRELSWKERESRLLKWNSLLTKRIDEIATLISKETGKPLSDARLEATLAIAHLSWAAKHAAKILQSESRAPGLLMANMSAKVEHVPFGVIGVIGPWNYPLFTPMGSIAYALAAGNAVVFKPSEYTPAVGQFLASTLAEVVPEVPLLQVVTGFASTGEALCRSKVGKIAFTGSTATAKKVAAVCAENLKPMIAECGGKDAVIVASDANLALAAELTLWAAMSNAGQSCIAAERVYVERPVATEFVKLISQVAQKLHPGSEANSSYGALTMARQAEIIESHIKDAIARGGKAVVGGEESVQRPYILPVIITDVPEDSLAMQEETFGPTICINAVDSIDEAIQLSNESRYGLGASVWSKDHGDEIASKLRCGMVSVNSAFAFAAVAGVPFGGVGDSGYGRIHGPEGLLEFTFARSVVSTRFKAPISFTTFMRTSKTDSLINKIVQILHGH
ncbi:MAG TPA: aldehyde dehydrogenase family protein [Candidatus Nanopelagicaceae bacterium]|nr:aldehyde dehydrogenase family protein [Candidatus Nanopelagicaceae bacterium]